VTIIAIVPTYISWLLLLAVLDLRVGHTMNRRPPCRSVVHFSNWLFKLQSRPWNDIVYPRRSWSFAFSAAAQGPYISL